MSKFKCDCCGLCCKKAGETGLLAKMGYDRGDGICILFDENTNLCKDYENRPMFCRVDDYYDEYLSDKMSREEFYKANYKCCRLYKLEELKKNGLI